MNGRLGGLAPQPSRDITVLLTAPTLRVFLNLLDLYAPEIFLYLLKSFRSNVRTKHSRNPRRH